MVECIICVGGSIPLYRTNAGMAKLAGARDLGSRVFGRAGSNPVTSTNKDLKMNFFKSFSLLLDYSRVTPIEFSRIIFIITFLFKDYLIISMVLFWNTQKHNLSIIIGRLFYFKGECA